MFIETLTQVFYIEVFIDLSKIFRYVAQCSCLALIVWNVNLFYMDMGLYLPNKTNNAIYALKN